MLTTCAELVTLAIYSVGVFYFGTFYGLYLGARDEARRLRGDGR